MAVLRDEARVEAVGGDVDGVHRLAPGPLARVRVGERGVGRPESLVDLVGEQVEVESGARLTARHDRTLVRTAARRGRLQSPTTSSTSNPSELSR